VSPDTPNVLQTMMQLRQAKSRTETANKLALEAEKERNAAEKAVKELKRQLKPKRDTLMIMLVKLMKFSQKLIIVVGVRYARVCEGEDLDPSREVQISCSTIQ
jgi:hypothetical protein